MRSRNNNAQRYIEMYPKLKKWINQCLMCRREGYKSSLPENISPGIAAQNIRKIFTELNLNENGLCELCDKIKFKK